MIGRLTTPLSNIPTPLSSLTWQHWGAQRLQVASVPPPPGLWREASPPPPSGHELFSELQSVLHSSNLSPCTLSHKHLLRSLPQVHIEYLQSLCPFLRICFPLSPSLVSCWIAGNPGEGDEPESFSQRHSHRKKSAHAMPRWQGDTGGGRHHLCQMKSNWAPGRQQEDCHHVLFRQSTQEPRCVLTSTPPPPITHSNSSSYHYHKCQIIQIKTFYR